MRSRSLCQTCHKSDSQLNCVYSKNDDFRTRLWSSAQQMAVMSLGPKKQAALSAQPV
jgi:hypothetical protein